MAVLALRHLRDLDIDAPRAAGGGRFLAAGSGLVRHRDHMYVIADNERELGVFPARGNRPGHLVRFLPGKLSSDPLVRKAEKPDLEGLALLPPDRFHPNGALMAIGSGSKPQRRAAVMWRLHTDGSLAGQPRHIDLGWLYRELERDIPDLNVEGVTVCDNRLLLFQRGNGRAGVNAVITLDLAAARQELADDHVSERPLLGVRRHDLGAIGPVRLCFSDASGLPDGRVVFTAVAEGGEDTYLDGVFGGAAIGVLTRDGAVQRLQRVEPELKLEGVAAEQRGRRVELWAVADADDPRRPSPVLAGSLELSSRAT